MCSQEPRPKPPRIPFSAKVLQQNLHFSLLLKENEKRKERRLLRGDTQWLKFGGTNDQASLTD